jgi:hypothetical protein
MKLSEAIRLGALLGPQVYGITFGDNYSSCAFGAALIAINHKNLFQQGGRYHLLSWTYIKDVWGWLSTSKVACPSCGQPEVLGSIVHLNDVHMWSRERIADFVSTIEPQEPTDTTTETTDVHLRDLQKV